MLLNYLSLSAYEVKTKLSLFERPLTVKKNGVFFFCKILSHSRDIQVKRK